ncbi:MAG TPA: hypothetical protein VGC55_18715 [Dokdonella sp.]
MGFPGAPEQASANYIGPEDLSFMPIGKYPQCVLFSTPSFPRKRESIGFPAAPKQVDSRFRGNDGVVGCGVM